MAVADQIEEPGSGLVERKVVQLLTPGTVTEERHLSADENYLAAVATGDGYALALLDVSTGEFRAAAFHTRLALYDELSRCRQPRQPSRVLNDRSTIMRTRGQDPTLPEMRRVRLLEMADAMDMFCQGLVCAFTVLRKN